MSFAGLKKQFNKANQLISEKIGGAKGSQVDEDSLILEKKIDALSTFATNVVSKVQDYLRPDAAARLKLATSATFSKVRGQSQESKYPQQESRLADVMKSASEGLEDEESEYSKALSDTADTFNVLAEMKDTLEVRVMQNFVEPVQQLTKDLKEINHHRKKLHGRRLDYDCKRRKAEKDASSFNQAELQVAEEKYEESKTITYQAMHNLLAQESEHIAHLNALVEALKDYHEASAGSLQSLSSQMEQFLSTAEDKPREEFVPRKSTKGSGNGATGGASVSMPRQVDGGGSTGSYSFGGPPEYTQPARGVDDDDDDSDDYGDHRGDSNGTAEAGNRGNLVDHQSQDTLAAKASAKALYDFEPENDGELAFSEGDVIELVEKIDENWYEGRVHGRKGFFPCNYVDVTVPL